MNIAEQQGLQLASILMISTPSKIDKDSARSHAFTKSLFCGSMSFHCRADDQMVLKIHRGFSQCFFSLTTTEIKENTHEHPYERFFGGRLFDEIVVPFGVGHLWNWKGRFGFGTTCFFLGHFCLDLIGMEKKIDDLSASFAQKNDALMVLMAQGLEENHHFFAGFQLFDVKHKPTRITFRVFWLPLLSFDYDLKHVFLKLIRFLRALVHPGCGCWKKNTSVVPFYLAGEAFQKPWRIFQQPWICRKKGGLSNSTNSSPKTKMKGHWIPNLTSPIVWDMAAFQYVSNETKTKEFLVVLYNKSLLGYFWKDDILRGTFVTNITRWWFQTFIIFTPIWGRFPIRLMFFKWVETTN